MISIIIATYNEKETILEMIHRIQAYIPDPLEIIVVDDDSPDGTWKHVADLQDPRVRLIRRTGEKGLASAILRGILESRGDLIGWWDADMLMCPARVPVMVERLSGCDIVIGSRYVDGGADRRRPVRVVTSAMLNWLANLVLGNGIRDYDSGFVLMKRSVLQQVLPDPNGFGEYFIEFIYRSGRSGLRVCEVPYILTERQVGTSKSLSGILHFLALGMKYGMRILVLRIRG